MLLVQWILSHKPKFVLMIAVDEMSKGQVSP